MASGRYLIMYIVVIFFKSTVVPLFLSVFDLDIQFPMPIVLRVPTKKSFPSSNNLERFECLSKVIIAESNNLLFIHMASVVISELAMVYDCHSA